MVSCIGHPIPTVVGTGYLTSDFLNLKFEFKNR